MKIKIETTVNLTKTGDYYQYAINGEIHTLTLDEMKKYGLVDTEEPDEDPIYEPEEDPDEDIPDEDAPVEVELPVCKVFLKDTLRNGSIIEAPEEIVWASPTTFSYNVFMTGPKGTQVRVEIDRGFTKYTTKEELTSRGPKVGFNRLNPMPFTLDGDNKIIIGTDLGPGSRSAGGYKADLVFKTVDNVELKRITLKCNW